MQNDYTLIIVDMQFGFLTSKGALPGCIREVKKAIEDRAPIIFLEYKGGFWADQFGDTLVELRDLIRDYCRVYFVSKISDDGSDEASDIMSMYKLPKTYMRICGVNTDACVQETVVGLSKKFDGALIDVIADACNANNDGLHVAGLNLMAHTSKVNIKNRNNLNG